MNNVEFGKRLVALGTALQDPQATLHDIVSMAHDVGLRLDMAIVPVEPPVASKPEDPEEPNCRLCLDTGISHSDCTGQGGPDSGDPCSCKQPIKDDFQLAG